MKVGEVVCAEGPIVLNAGRKVREVAVTNKGDRPVQVGSHCHFFEVNRCLSFDRAAAFGYRLDVPSGNSVRFEPGEEKVVRLVELGGAKRVFGVNDLTRGATEPRDLPAALERARRRGFLEYEEGHAAGFAPGWDDGAEDAAGVEGKEAE